MDAELLRTDSRHESQDNPGSATDLLCLSVPLFPSVICKATGIKQLFNCLGKKYSTGQQKETHLTTAVFSCSEAWQPTVTLKLAKVDSNVRRRNHDLSLQERQRETMKMGVLGHF